MSPPTPPAPELRVVIGLACELFLPCDISRNTRKDFCFAERVIALLGALVDTIHDIVRTPLSRAVQARTARSICRS